MTNRPAPLLAIALLALAGSATPVRAQDTVRAVVQYLAGANVYLDVGTDRGLRPGDTLAVRRVPSGEAAGPLVVVSGTPGRSVAAFAGAPYSLTRGDTLALSITHVADRGTPLAAAPAPLVPPTAALPARRRVTTDGSVSLDFDLLQTTTTGLGASPEQQTRNFTTPSLGFRYRAQGLGGGWEFRTGLRATQRSSTGGVVDPATLVQVYELALLRRGRRGEIQLGRFYDPYESYSGYWDGVMLHRGTSAGGVGVLAGFTPDRGNAGFQSSEPKLGGVAHFRSRGTGVRYRSEVALDLLFPRDTAGTHAIAGWGQAVEAGGLLLSSSLQADRMPLMRRWGVTRLYTRLSTRLGTAGTLYTGYTLNRLDLGDTTTGVIPYRRDQVNAGLTFWSGGKGFSADVSTSRQHALPTQWAWSANATARGRGAAALGGGLVAMYWTGGPSHGLLVSPSVLRRFGAVDGQFDYQYYRSASGTTTSVSHAFELGARLPLSAHTQFSIRLRERIGDLLKSSGVSAGLWYGF
ncbi:MAG TPA: hypothetical protein VFI13_13635 [Gemmatimonadales bacterium]|nr:hypothetical protein [Gemmatimonadales bacterium]